MIIYQNDKKGFREDVLDGLIADKIEEAFKDKHIPHNNDSEYVSWENSLVFMNNAITSSNIADDCRIAIEYQVPLTSKRVDFLIAGKDDTDNNNVVIVELKQWSE